MDFLFPLLTYLYIAYATQTIAKKTNMENTWWAWVPLLNLLLWVKIAEKSYWWVLGIIIPIVNIVAVAYIWSKIAERLHKSSWHGILMLIPVVNFFVIGYLAFTSTYETPKTTNKDLSESENQSQESPNQSS